MSGASDPRETASPTNTPLADDVSARGMDPATRRYLLALAAAVALSLLVLPALRWAVGCP